MGLLEIPTMAISKCIHYNKRQVTRIRARIYWSGGSVRLFVNLNGNINSPSTSDADWEEITGLQNGLWTTFTPTIIGGYVYLKIIKDYDTVIYEPQDTSGQPTAPAVSTEITTGTAPV